MTEYMRAHLWTMCDQLFYEAGTYMENGACLIHKYIIIAL